MAIDPVREKHEAWLRLACRILAVVLVSVTAWNAFQTHMSWDSYVVQYCWWLFLAASVLSGGWRLLSTLLVAAVVLWADLHDKPLNLQTIRHLPIVDWMLVVIVFLFLLLIVFASIQKLFGKRQLPTKLPA